MVVVLLESGADPNLKNKDENTPLHVAAAEGREEVVKRLVRRLHARKAKQRTHLSCLMILALLQVQKGADVAAWNKQRWQSSHWAAAGGHASVLKQVERYCFW